MKRSPQQPALAILMLALLNIGALTVSGQNYREKSFRYPNTYIGVEAAMGTKTFLLNSNIPAIDGLKTKEEGFSLGLVVGGNVVHGKIRTGYFSPSSAMTEKLTLRNYELQLNAFPLAMLRTRSNFFRPYILAGIDRSVLKFYGSYTLPAPPAQQHAPAPGLPCDPDFSPAPEPVPDSPDPTETPAPSRTIESAHLGTVVVVRFTTGVGLAVHVPTKRNFLNFFMEANYGLPMGANATTPQFDGTSAKGQLSCNAGLSVGIRR